MEIILKQLMLLVLGGLNFKGFDYRGIGLFQYQIFI